MSKAVTRLFNSFQPEQYLLRLSPDAASGRVPGSVTIHGKKTGRPSQRLTFHGHGIKVLKATIIKHDRKNGDVDIEVSRINLHASSDEIRLHSDQLLYAGDYSVTMEFESAVQKSMHGIYRSSYMLDGQPKVLLSTQFESHHAREAFPCVDEPEAKAVFDLSLDAPATETVISNMPETDRQTLKDGLERVRFAATPRMSTYLLAFVIGDLQRQTTSTTAGVAVSVYATKAHSSEALAFALETTKRCIEFFDEYYQVAYPLPKCDMVAIPDFSSAAMENWGLVTYREPFLLADPATASQSSRELIATVICHELSHQWFGNLVTMKWWDDLWLNESFANVMEYVGVDALFPEWQVFNTFTSQEGLSAFRRDSIAGVQSIKTEVRHPDEISTLFDPSIVYAKGGRLLNMLRNYIGEDSFRAGLKSYFQKHQYGNTVGDDLWAALATASGKDVAGFMNPWLQQSGFPVVSVDQTGSAVRIEQHHFLLDATKADDNRLWPIPTLASAEQVPPLLSDKDSTVTLSSDDYVRLNQHAVGHYLVRYTQPAHAEYLAKLAADKQLTEAERLMLLSDSALLARSGTASLSDTLRLLQHYANEDTEPVWDIMALVLADARRFIDASPDLESHVKMFVRELIESQYQRLGWHEQPQESTQDTKLRGTILGLGSYAEHPAIQATALELFEAYKTDAAVVSSELRPIVFTTAIRQDVPQAFDYLLELEKTTTDPTLKQELLGALSATRSTERGRQLLARLTDPQLVRPHDVDHWLVYLMRNRYNRDQAWQWLRDNWQWIETTFAGDKSYDSFPRYAASALNSRQHLSEYRDFFVPLVNQPLLTRNITMGIEELDNRVSWIERDNQAVGDFFASLRS